jgi:hypothetical protein
VILPTKGSRGGDRRAAGFAFVHFKDEAHATTAVEKLADTRELLILVNSFVPS